MIMIVFRVEAEKPVHPFNYIRTMIHKQKLSTLKINILNTNYETY